MLGRKPVALVTGGAKGIGHAIVRQLLSSGWKIGVVDVADSGLRRVFARERNVLAIEGDVRDEGTASQAVDLSLSVFAVSTAWCPMPAS